MEMLSFMFGADAVSPFIKNDRMTVTVDDKTALIDLHNMVGFRQAVLFSSKGICFSCY